MKYLIYILLLYFIGVFQFFGSVLLLQGCHYFFLALGLGAFAYYILFKKISTVALCIGLYCIVFPLYAAVKSHEVFGQPYFMGFASLRYLGVILVGFFLYNIKYDYKLLLKQINGINIVVAVTSIVAFFIFNIDHISVQHYLVSTNELEFIATEDFVKGSKLTICSGLMIISYIYYLLCFMKSPFQRKYWLPFSILVIYLIFVNKGRQPIALMAIIYAVYYFRMNRITFKRVILGILPIVGAFVVISYSDALFNSLVEATKWEKSQDFSTLARVNSVDSVVPYIRQNPILGFGNLSVHFRDEGFHTYFGEAFYLADIGIWGTLARGGALLLLIYMGLYYSLYKRTTDVKDRDIRSYMRYMILSFVIMLILLNNDTLYADNCLTIALLFYPLFGSVNPNIFFNNTHGRLHYHS